MDNFKIQMIAIQALDKKYGFTPSPQQVKLLESDGEGTYILFRVGEHEYHFEDGEIINIEDRKKCEEAIEVYFNMFLEANKDRGIAEDRIKILTKHNNELRFKNRELLDANNQLKKERDEFIKSWLSMKDAADELNRILSKQTR